MTEAIKHLWEVEHKYSGADQNYYMPMNMQDALFVEHKSWKAFTKSDSYESDMDYNLMYRWDWKKDREYQYPEKEHLVLYWLQQRRGCVGSDTIYVTADDEPAVREWLQKYADHMRDLWAPLDMGVTND